MPILVCFSGLPAVGKTTLAKRVARALGAVYLRVDTVEQTLRECGFTDDQIGGNGYSVVCGLATENLFMGRQVVADQVNPWALTREMFHQAARTAGGTCLDVEVVCSDQAEHQRRAKERVGDIDGLELPDWEAIQSRDYHPWDRPVVTIDTAKMSEADAVAAILRAFTKC
jgi:predicted kinase